MLVQDDNLRIALEVCREAGRIRNRCIEEHDFAEGRLHQGLRAYCGKCRAAVGRIQELDDRRVRIARQGWRQAERLGLGGDER
jgi:hypothetical protein